MRLIRNILIGLVALVAVLAVVGMLLPRQVVVERDIVIDAPPEDVFAHVNSLQAFAEWSPWGDYDPDMVVTYSGPETGVGNVMEWTSEHPNVGNGRQEITHVVENERVMTALDFGDMGTADAWWQLAPDGDGTRVVWGLDADMGGGPVGRWFGLMMDRWVGADYERGLARLQETVES
ncbi:SRPBCC family protein [Hasllibacter sp. MH4015]|uniref:SRPBCC family protein n=1 Tax=Hasllibacter sp. MH4015 TaxID=2854029 RepID=UPI001CD2A263|nr:SRPBCC family protein [Hasllibacter sp. MH4015]